jgi:hypothetical protein
MRQGLSFGPTCWTRHSVIFDLPDQPLNIRSKRAFISSRFLLPFSHHHPLPRRILSLFSAVLSLGKSWQTSSCPPLNKLLNYLFRMDQALSKTQRAVTPRTTHR